MEGVIRTSDTPSDINSNWDSNNPDPSSSSAPWKIYNIGNNRPIKLMDYIDALEKALSKKAKINFLPLQPGDVPDTYADVTSLKNKFNYKPSTSVVKGVSKFIEWYKKLFSNMIRKRNKLNLAIIGLGYVGLPLALEFAKKRKVIGFDVDSKRIKHLNLGKDKNLEFSKNKLLGSKFLKYSVI